MGSVHVRRGHEDVWTLGSVHVRRGQRQRKRTAVRGVCWSRSSEKPRGRTGERQWEGVLGGLGQLRDHSRADTERRGEEGKAGWKCLSQRAVPLPSEEGPAGPSGHLQAKSDVRDVQWLKGMGLLDRPCCSQSLAENHGFRTNAVTFRGPAARR